MNHLLAQVGAAAYVGELITNASTYFSVVEISGQRFSTSKELLGFLQSEFAAEYERLTK